MAIGERRWRCEVIRPGNNTTENGAGEFPLPTRPPVGSSAQSTSRPLSMIRSQQTEEAYPDLSSFKREMERAQKERDKANLDRDGAKLERAEYYAQPRIREGAVHLIMGDNLIRVLTRIQSHWQVGVLSFSGAATPQMLASLEMLDMVKMYTVTLIMGTNDVP